MSTLKDDISIVICGEAGQGMDTVSDILAKVFKLSGYHVFSTKEFMSRIRGGSNSSELRVSSRRVSAYVDKIDFLIPLSKNAINHLKKRVVPDTIVFTETHTRDEFYADKCRMIDIPFTPLSQDLGNKIYSNVIAAGVILGLCKVDPKLLENYLREAFAHKPEEVISKNIQAAYKGHQIGLEVLEKENISIQLISNPNVKDELLLSGTDAVALGCIAGGCNFVSAYPMSPSTGVLSFLAEQSKEFGIIVEQAEDEIAAINMAIGAWYAGARGLATTSGGGFALMEEGISLAGMIETPIIIHLSQRPGPATGLPTRTEQGDLELALYSGHGECPKILLSPGTIQDAFYLSQQAFNLADKFQSPVIILSDQYLVDSYYNIPSLDLSDIKVEHCIIETDENYKRYQLTENGITPRGIPGYGKGLVSVDSDEHDEEGHITENLDLRVDMVNKRLKKLDLIKQEIFPPELIGSENYKTLIIGWGSTYHIIREALELLNNDEVSFLHYKQVYPLHSKTLEYLNKAETTIIVENNATSQFGKLIKLYTGYEIESKILKYNGLPFSVEEILRGISNIVRGKSYASTII